MIVTKTWRIESGWTIHVEPGSRPRAYGRVEPRCGAEYEIMPLIHLPEVGTGKKFEERRCWRYKAVVAPYPLPVKI